MSGSGEFHRLVSIHGDIVCDPLDLKATGYRTREDITGVILAKPCNG